MIRLDFKTRLALWHVAAVALILAVAAVAADRALARVVLGHIVDGAVLALAEAEAAALQADPGRPIHVHERAGEPPSFARLDKFVQIVGLDGRVLARSANLGAARLPISPAVLARVASGETVFETRWDFGEEPVRLVSLPVDVQGTGYAVQVAMSLDDAHAVLRAGRWLFAAMSLAILLAVGLTGGVLTRRALRPIDEIVQRARRIGQANLAERLPHPGTQDELGRLVDTLNAMLARIETGFEALRRFTTDAAHELRSPLSRLRAELEVTLRRPRENAEYQEALRSCLEEAEHLSQLVEELLTLAHLEAGQARERAGEPTALPAVIEGTARRFEDEAARRGVTIVVEPTPALFTTVTAGAAGLALGNVLENAVKFSPPGAQVAIGLSRQDGEAVVAVRDAGPGIAAEELPGIFERFRRGRAAGAGTPGFGLGLAIARAVLEQRGGRITVESRPGGGTTFRLHLPLAS